MEGPGLESRIARRASLAGMGMDASLASALGKYVELLQRWNRRMNLTGLGEGDGGLDRLVVEPLVAAQHMGAGAASVVDIGSGGGSPAVPLKLAVPRLELRMVESKKKKAAFLREVVWQMGLEDVVVETCRYEELWTRPELQRAADVVTVRAVRVRGPTLAGLQRLVRVGGALWLFRGAGQGDVRSEVRRPLRWRGTYPLVESLGSQLVVLEKRLR